MVVQEKGETLFMEKKTASAIMLTLLLTSMLTLAFNVQPVKAEGTIYIRADGSIDPPDAPISTVDNVTYTLTGNITSDADGIVVERSNITIDGDGYTVLGTGTENGFYISGTTNVTIKNTIIKSFGHGIYLYVSSNGSIFGNNIMANNYDGIWLEWSSFNSIFGNNITDNDNGIYIYVASNNSIYHNDFIDNVAQVYSERSVNLWDDGYPSGGNYWSDYVGVDVKSGPDQDLHGSDGIGDTPYVTDRYPLMYPWSPIRAIGVGFSLANTFYFNVTVKNFGITAVGISKVTMALTNGTVLEIPGYEIIPALPYRLSVNQTVTLNCPWEWANYQGKNATIKVFTSEDYSTEVTLTLPIPTYALTITATAGGLTTPTPGTYSYTANSQVQVIAFLNTTAYLFDHWKLDEVNVGSANPYSVYMDKDHTLKAVFSPIPPPLSASISPLSASILVGQSVTFTSTVSGGYTPYSYQWYLNGNPVSGATSNTWTFTPTTSGIYYVHLKATDAKANTAQSDAARIAVATVPVGGYSFSIQVQTGAEPIIPYIALIATLTAVFTKLRPKTKRKR